MIPIFIGYDPCESVAWHVLAHSILSRASVPVSIVPLKLDMLKDEGLMWRDADPMQSTDFAFSRFLVPYLCDYKGHAIFMDCDMLMLDDIAKLLPYFSGDYAVKVVKHDYQPKTLTKFLGHTQAAYPRKNWSSLMLFNCSDAGCERLTPELVNTATGLALHRFDWIPDSLIGELPPRWNHLIGEYDKLPAEDISCLHYTLGGPYFDEYKDCDYADLWFREYYQATRPLAHAGRA